MLRLIRRLAWGGIAVLGLLMLATTGGWLVTDGPLAPPIATGPASLAIGGPFSLTDHTGRAVTEQDFADRPVVIFFGFTACPSVCPTTLNSMTSLIEALGPDAARLHWLFVGVDSERDTPAAMADYVQAFDPHIRGLSGTEAQIARAARAFRVFYRRVPIEGGYTMDHSASIFLLGTQGRFAGTIDHEEPDKVALEKLKLLLASR